LRVSHVIASGAIDVEPRPTVVEAVVVLSGGVPAVIAVANGEPAGLVTRTDLLDRLVRRS
jgi:predicted transcriptional regulator